MSDPAVAEPQTAGASTFRAGRNLMTPHQPEDYPGLTVVQVGQWAARVIVPEPGQTIEARGGESIYAYELPDGTHAQGFALERGDRATCVRTDLPHCLCEWRVERARPTLD
jgi:hypothetical protein